MTIKITHIITGLGVGGAETMLLKMLTQCDRKNFDVSVISLTSQVPMASTIEKQGIPVIVIGMRAGKVRIPDLLKLRQKIRELNPDLIQTWMYHADLIGGLIAWTCGIRKIIWSIRNGNLSRSAIKGNTIIVAKISAALSHILPATISSCSKIAAEVHIRAGYSREKIRVISNGFDLAKFRPDKTAKEKLINDISLNGDPIIIGIVARFDPQKDHRSFIQAATMIADQLPNAHFVMMGTNIDAQNMELMDWINASGKADRFVLLGRRDDVPALIPGLDVLVQSSIGEAFPNVLGEAMACGVPCIATDVGDSAEIVADTGYIVPASRPDRLAEAILAFFSLPKEQRENMSIKARERVATHYDIAAITQQYEALYRELLTNT